MPRFVLYFVYLSAGMAKLNSRSEPLIFNGLQIAHFYTGRNQTEYAYLLLAFFFSFALNIVFRCASFVF